MKRLLVASLLIILVFFTHHSAQSQYYLSGQEPASVRWNQLNSEYFQVIYPHGYDSVAQHVMNIMEYSRSLMLKTHEVEPKKIAVILHNSTTISNAQVAWAPRRMEYYTIPDQNTYSQPWFEQLALHEFTHTQQLSDMNQGITRFLGKFFGEQVAAGIFGLYVPYWFIEGEAVSSETAFSKAGRGRDPVFEAELRSQILELGAYSLEKADLGSYKDFTTDRYHLGYFLVAQAKAKYGADFWKKPLKNVAKYPLAVVPFAQGIKTNSGLKKKTFYTNTLSELKMIWDGQLKLTKPTKYEPVTSNETYTTYSGNRFRSDGKIISLKENFHDIGRLVQIDTAGNEVEIFTPGFYQSDKLSVSDGWVCWAEYKFDARWSYRNFTKIRLFNSKTGETKTLVKKARYFAPAIAPAGDKVAMVEVDEKGRNFLVILSAENGQILQKFQSPDNDFIAHPAWSEKGDRIVMELLNGHGKALSILSLESGHFQQILPYQFTHIQNPGFWKNYVLFEAAYSGVMNLYALDIETKSIYRTTNSAYSMSDYSISPDGNTLIFSDYSSKGKSIVKTRWNKKDWIPISEVENHGYPLADLLSKQVKKPFVSENIPQEKYEARKYNKLANAINIHSWNFIGTDNYALVGPGINLMSQNVLSNLTASVGANYNLNTESMQYSARIDYLGWYPAFSFYGDYRKVLDYVTIHDQWGISDTVFFNYYETNLGASVYLPLVYRSGHWSHRVQPQVSFSYQQADGGLDEYLSQRNFKSLAYTLDYAAQTKSPWQNVYPRWGYNLQAGFFDSPFDSHTGHMKAAGLVVYTPGLFRHDGFRWMGHYQDKENGRRFSNYVSPARGYSYVTYGDLLTLRADYKVPLFYPDARIGSLFYFKRIKMALFYDRSWRTEVNVETALFGKSNYWSSGIDFTTDVHLLRSKFLFELGIRTIYVNGASTSPRGIYWEFLYSVGL